MAAPQYYDNSDHRILDGTIAQASDVEDKCNDIATSFADVAADMDNTLRFSATDFTDQVFPQSAEDRAWRVVGFNGTGQGALLAWGVEDLYATMMALNASTLVAKDTAILAQTNAAEAAVVSAEYAAQSQWSSNAAYSSAMAAAQTAANVGSLLGINFGAFSVIDGELIVTHLTTASPYLSEGELILAYETLE